MHGALRLLAAGILLFGAGVAHGADPRLNQPISLDRPDQALFAEAVLIYSNEVRRQHGRASRSQLRYRRAARHASRHRPRDRGGDRRAPLSQRAVLQR